MGGRSRDLARRRCPIKQKSLIPRTSTRKEQSSGTVRIGRFADLRRCGPSRNPLLYPDHQRIKLCWERPCGSCTNSCQYFAVSQSRSFPAPVPGGPGSGPCHTMAVCLLGWPSVMGRVGKSGTEETELEILPGGALPELLPVGAQSNCLS